MRLSDFDFDLPDRLIALRPARPRDSARLLHVGGDGVLADHGMLDLAGLLRPGDLLVLNDTRVLPAALTGQRPARPEGGGGPARISVNLHHRDGPAVWRAFVKPAKRLRRGDMIWFGRLSATVSQMRESGEAVLAFDLAGEALDAAIAAEGAPPLPPYIASKRAPDAADVEDYQTLFSAPEKTGSVAAPTAGLHFTERLFATLETRGVQTAHVTLNVGAGTFLPVKSEDVTGHVMHAEWFEISPEAAEAVNAAKAEGRRVIPVGTTALRTLESAADESGRVAAGAAETAIFITPGYRFRATDALVTNFHLPRSTLFMLVCALAGRETMQRAYAHAIAQGYRFFSYGDACLIKAARGA